MRFQLGSFLQKVQCEAYISLIEVNLYKLSATTLESETIEKSVHERRPTIINLVIIAKTSAIFASRALVERIKEECQILDSEKQTTPIMQRLEVGRKEAST